MRIGSTWLALLPRHTDNEIDLSGAFCNYYAGFAPYLQAELYLGFVGRKLFEEMHYFLKRRTYFRECFIQRDARPVRNSFWVRGGKYQVVADFALVNFENGKFGAALLQRYSQQVCHAYSRSFA
jgi:hypothetical protein